MQPTYPIDTSEHKKRVDRRASIASYEASQYDQLPRMGFLDTVYLPDPLPTLFGESLHSLGEYAVSEKLANGDLHGAAQSVRRRLSILALFPVKDDAALDMMGLGNASQHEWKDEILLQESLADLRRNKCLHVDTENFAHIIQEEILSFEQCFDMGMQRNAHATLAGDFHSTSIEEFLCNLGNFTDALRTTAEVEKHGLTTANDTTTFITEQLCNSNTSFSDMSTIHSVNPLAVLASSDAINSQDEEIDVESLAGHHHRRISLIQIEELVQESRNIKEHLKIFAAMREQERNEMAEQLDTLARLMTHKHYRRTKAILSTESHTAISPNLTKDSFSDQSILTTAASNH